MAIRLLSCFNSCLALRILTSIGNSNSNTSPLFQSCSIDIYLLLSSGDLKISIGCPFIVTFNKDERLPLLSTYKPPNERSSPAQEGSLTKNLNFIFLLGSTVNFTFPSHG